jgi:hypothetical protein
MTPQEKAKQLFMRNFEITVDDYCAKQCALIAVDEILSNDGWSGSREEWHRFKIYFDQVKHEITQL